MNNDGFYMKGLWLSVERKMLWETNNIFNTIHKHMKEVHANILVNCLLTTLDTRKQQVNWKKNGNKILL